MFIIYKNAIINLDKVQEISKFITSSEYIIRFIFGENVYKTCILFNSESEINEHYDSIINDISEDYVCAKYLNLKVF